MTIPQKKMDEITTNYLEGFTKLIHDNSNASLETKISTLSNIVEKIYMVVYLISENLDTNLNYTSSTIQQLNPRLDNLENKINYLEEDVKKAELAQKTAITQLPQKQEEPVKEPTLRSKVLGEIKGLMDKRKSEENNFYK
ncbi:Uncharacterised protein [Candidatus Tiddalikarchaeum anstoanum]|nr:Uncharacterised protein [Candidatus Tiddalikarchaeum anstoanum]